jgi:hypothetical protein
MSNTFHCETFRYENLQTDNVPADRLSCGVVAAYSRMEAQMSTVDPAHLKGANTTPAADRETRLAPAAAAITVGVLSLLAWGVLVSAVTGARAALF